LFGIGSLYYNGFYKAKDVFAGFSLAAQTTYNYTVETVRLLGELVQALLPQTQDRTALQMVSGPIGVSYFSHSVFNFSGIRGILELMALISISLAAVQFVQPK